jgi:hypothetical protein
MSPEQKKHIKTNLLEVLLHEKDNILRSEILDAINKVAENIFENEEKWEELVLLTINLLSVELRGENVATIECGLILLKRTFIYIYDEYLPKLEDLTGLFKNFYKSTSLYLKTMTTWTVSAMIADCNKTEMKLFCEFIFNIKETTLNCINESKNVTNVKYP